MSQSITWQVKGANWRKNITAPQSSCPLEIATTAVEQIWQKETGSGENPSVGLILEVSHQNMTSPQEHIMVLSALVLANAGFYEESFELNRIWEEQKNQ